MSLEDKFEREVNLEIEELIKQDFQSLLKNNSTQCHYNKEKLKEAFATVNTYDGLSIYDIFRVLKETIRLSKGEKIRSKVENKFYNSVVEARIKLKSK